MESGNRLTKFQQLLAEFPKAIVTALNSDGLLVPLPTAISIDRHQVIEGRSLVEWVVAKDRIAVANLWFEVSTAGWASAPLRLMGAPTVRVVLHFVDLRDALGVVLAAIVPSAVEGHVPEVSHATASHSRFAAYLESNMGVILDCDQQSAAVLGSSPAELIGSQGLDLVHPEDQAHVIDGWLEMMARKQPLTMRYRHRRGDREWVWVDGTLHNHLSEPDLGHVRVELIDVSEAMAAKEALEAQEMLLNRLADVLPVGLFQVGTDRAIAYSNGRLHAILGTPANSTLEDVLRVLGRSDRAVVEGLLAAVLERGQDADVEVGNSHAGTGELRRCMMNFRALMTKTGNVSGAIVCVSDITESARMRIELEDRATFDALTRCHNRASIMDILERSLPPVSDTGTAVIFIDLDKFKPINDMLGHAAGDDLLVVVARRLQHCLRTGDSLGRLGGDEFLIVCPRLVRPEEAATVAQRISETLTSVVTLKGHPVDIKASIGLAIAAPGMNADGLVAAADAAMYESKRQGEGLPVRAVVAARGK